MPFFIFKPLAEKEVNDLSIRLFGQTGLIKADYGEHEYEFTYAEQKAKFFIKDDRGYVYKTEYTPNDETNELRQYEDDILTILNPKDDVSRGGARRQRTRRRKRRTAMRRRVTCRAKRTC
jgi:hypothetical protein